MATATTATVAAGEKKGGSDNRTEWTATAHHEDWDHKQTAEAVEGAAAVTATSTSCRMTARLLLLLLLLLLLFERGGAQQTSCQGSLQGGIVAARIHGRGWR